MLFKTVTANNDNSYARRLFYNRSDDEGSLTRLMQYIPTARSLIKKYIKSYWKHSPQHASYTFCEYQLCTILDKPAASSAQRFFFVSDIAFVLKVEPLTLMNDPLFKL